jgi:hypothetical protein
MPEVPSNQLVHAVPQIGEVLVSAGKGVKIAYALLYLWISCFFCKDTFGQPPPQDAEFSPKAEAGTETPKAPFPQTWTEEYRKKAIEKAYIKGPNVHRSPLYCSTCHEKGEKPSGENLLYGGDDLVLCRTCHPKSVYDVHVVDIRPRKVEVPPAFPLPGGKVTCVTCHDEPSCNPKDSPSWTRPFFLRGTKTGYLFCFECHAKQEYAPYNPHNPKHLRSEEDRTNNCLFCHTSVVPVEPRRGLAFASLKAEPDDLCSACHLKEPHLGAPAHLALKTGAYRALLLRAEEEAGPLLPLGKQGEPLCVSCHDPHIPGLIPEPEEGADVWIEGGTSQLRQDYLKQSLFPFVTKRIEELKTEYGQPLLAREPGWSHPPQGKLLRKGLQKDGSLCLLCHDVFEGEPGRERRYEYRILY